MQFRAFKNQKPYKFFYCYFNMKTENLILDKLDEIKAEMILIRENLTDVVLTEDDINSLDEAEQDLKAGKTKRL